MLRNMVAVGLVVALGAGHGIAKDAAVQTAGRKNQARVYISQSGQMILKVVPHKGKLPVLGTLVALQPDGGEKVLWKKPLPRFPLKAYLSDLEDGFAYVLIQDHPYHRVQRDESKAPDTIIFDQSGKAILDYENFEAAPPERAPAPALIRSEEHSWRLPVVRQSWSQQSFKGKGADQFFVSESASYFFDPNAHAQRRIFTTSTVTIDLKTGISAQGSESQKVMPRR